MRWPFVSRSRLNQMELQRDIARGNEAILSRVIDRERGEHAKDMARLSTNAYELIVAGSHVIDAAAALPELDGWHREHVELEAALGELVAALGPFAVTVRRAKVEKRASTVGTVHALECREATCGGWLMAPSEHAKDIARRAVARIVAEHKGAWGGLLLQIEDLERIVAEEVERPLSVLDVTRSSEVGFPAPIGVGTPRNHPGRVNACPFCDGFFYCTPTCSAREVNPERGAQPRG